MSDLEATSETTLAVVLGASEWPYHPGLSPLKAAERSAIAFRDYLLNESEFALPPDNLEYLFDSHHSASKLVIRIKSFLRDRINDLKTENRPPRDLIVYYVGHGDFYNDEYFLAVRETNQEALSHTIIRATDLAEILKDEARFLRHHIIIDSCYSEAATYSFQGDPAQIQAHHLSRELVGLPAHGTAILSSAEHSKRSKSPKDEALTMFSATLVEVLKHGDAEAHTRPKFSLADLQSLLRKRVFQKYGSDAVLPKLSTPRAGDQPVSLGQVPIFPNVAFRLDDLEPSRHIAESEGTEKTEQQTTEIETNLRAVGTANLNNDSIKFIRNRDKMVTFIKDSYSVHNKLSRHLDNTRILIQKIFIEHFKKLIRNLLRFSFRSRHVIPWTIWSFLVALGFIAVERGGLRMEPEYIMAPLIFGGILFLALFYPTYFLNIILSFYFIELLDEIFRVILSAEKNFDWAIIWTSLSWESVVAALICYLLCSFKLSRRGEI